MDRRNGEKKQDASSKKSTEIYANANGGVARESSPDDREIEFPEKEILPSRLVHLFISGEGCASTCAIEMKFLINK